MLVIICYDVSTEPGEEKQGQLTRLRDFHARNKAEASKWQAKLKQTVIEDGNVFAVLVDAVRYCSLGQITSDLYEVGGNIGAACKRLP